MITIKHTGKSGVIRGKNRKIFGIILGGILYGRSGLPTGGTVGILYLAEGIYSGGKQDVSDINVGKIV